MDPPLTVCRVFIGTRQPALPDVIVRTHCYYSGNRGYCWDTLLKQWEPKTLFVLHIVGSRWPQVTSQQWPWTPLLPLLPPSSKSDRSPRLIWVVVINSVTCLHHRPWCGLKNALEISAYFGEFTFPVIFLFLELPRFILSYNLINICRRNSSWLHLFGTRYVCSQHAEEIYFCSVWAHDHSSAVFYCPETL
jgi:hypothetical protein